MVPWKFTGQAGWAQINGRDDIPIPTKVEYDEYYLNPSGFIPRGLPRLLSFRRKPESRKTDWIPCQARNDIRYPAACSGVVHFASARPGAPLSISARGRMAAEVRGPIHFSGG